MSRARVSWSLAGVTRRHRSPVVADFLETLEALRPNREREPRFLV